MKFTSRLKFFFGIIIVLALVGALVLYLINSMSTVESYKAVLAADTSSLGTDYPGLIVKQNAEVGDKVKKGETLFEVNSAQLNGALNNGTASLRTLPFSVDPNSGNILIKAPDDGVVSKVFFPNGSFVPTGGIIANINTVGSLYVVATFKLSPPDYARINKHTTLSLTFPDNTTMQATVFDITLVSDGDRADTVMRARLKNADISDFRFSVGTPVQATLKLNTSTWYQELYNYILRLFKPGAA